MFKLKKRSFEPVVQQVSAQNKPEQHVRRRCLASPKAQPRESVGTCPTCRGDVFEMQDSFACRQYPDECNFVFKKQKLAKLGKKTITACEMGVLLDYESIPLRGLRKSGEESFDVSGELVWSELWGWGIRFDHFSKADPLPPVPSLRRRFLKNP